MDVKIKFRLRLRPDPEGLSSNNSESLGFGENIKFKFSKSELHIIGTKYDWHIPRERIIAFEAGQLDGEWI